MYVAHGLRPTVLLHVNDIKLSGLCGNFGATMSPKDAMHKYANTVPFLKGFACFVVSCSRFRGNEENSCEKPLHFASKRCSRKFRISFVTIFKRQPYIQMPKTFINRTHYLTHRYNSFIFVYVIQYNRGSITFALWCWCTMRTKHCLLRIVHCSSK